MQHHGGVAVAVLSLLRTATPPHQKRTHLGLGWGALPPDAKPPRKVLVIFVAALQEVGKMVKPQVGELSGAALVARIRADMVAEGLEPDGREVELLSLAEDLQDRIVELEAAITAEGLTSVSKGGLVRLHPAVAEVRQTRAALARVLSGVQLQDDSRDPVKQKAAQSRWRAHNQAKKRTVSF